MAARDEGRECSAGTMTRAHSEGLAGNDGNAASIRRRFVAATPHPLPCATMFSRSRQLFATGMFVVDAILIAAAWLGAYELRFHVLAIPAPRGIPPLSLYLWSGAVLTPTALLVLRAFRLHRSARTGRLGFELLGVIQAVLVLAALAGVLSFYLRGELSRTVIALFLGLATLALSGVRVAARLVLRALRRRGHNLRHVLV